MDLIRYNNVNDMAQVNTLRIVAKMLMSCACSITVLQAIQKDNGEINTFQVKNTVCDCDMRIIPDEAHNVMYTVIRSNEKQILFQIKKFFKIVLDRAEYRFHNGNTKEERENDYILVLDFIKEDLVNELVYQFSLPYVEKVEWSPDRDDEMILTSPIDEPLFGIGRLSQQELEYAMMLNREREKAERGSYGVDEETDW